MGSKLTLGRRILELTKPKPLNQWPITIMGRLAKFAR